MPGERSTLPAARAALAELVGLALPGVQVSDGEPAKIADVSVFVHDEADGRHSIPVMGAGRKEREEEYTLRVVVAVVLPKGSVRDAVDRAFELLAGVEDVLADDPSLGLGDALVFEATAGAWRLNSGKTKTGPGAVVLFDVDCIARID